MSDGAAKGASNTAAQEKEGVLVLKMLPIFIMGKRYEVPQGLTVMKAMEYAGYKFIRGCGCRDGKCGACATVYRKPGDYHIRVGLACQTEIEANMYLTQIPFYPANRATYDFEKIKGTPEDIFKLYPELFRCVACNTCTKTCPMDVQVMDIVAALKRGDIAKAANLSFDCIQCGLCTSRCMGELPQYHIAQLARRIYGGKMLPRAEHLKETLKVVTSGKFEAALREIMSLDDEGLKEAYVAREMEPETAGDGWTPKDKHWLLDVED